MVCQIWRQDQSMLSCVIICQCHMSAQFNCGLWWTRNIVFVILLISCAIVHLILNMVVIAMSNIYPTGNKFHRLRFPSYLRESPLWLPKICNCNSLHNMTFMSFHIFLKLHVDHEWLAFIIYIRSYVGDDNLGYHPTIVDQSLRWTWYAYEMLST